MFVVDIFFVVSAWMIFTNKFGEEIAYGKIVTFRNVILIALF